MNPVFDGFLKFLEYHGVDLNKEGLIEGFYWFDRQIVKAFDKNGNQHKILRMYTDDKLNVTIKHYKKEEFEIASWDDLILLHKDRIDKLSKDSLKLIKERIDLNKDYTIYIFNSGGKDSMLTWYLVNNIKKSVSLFNNTSLDCADTYKFIKKIDNLKILNPEEGFYQWRDILNYVPTRFRRSCCSIFKEGETIKHIDAEEKCLIFMGMRNSESNTRSDYGDDWKNNKWGDREWQGVLPIRKWDELDVWLYTIKNNIPINEKYKKGYSRVGCAIACPFYNKSTWVLDKYWYPEMYERWQKIITKDFIDNFKWTRMNCTIEEYQTNWNGGLIRTEPTEEVIKEFAKYKNIDYDVAKKYFNNECSVCGGKVNDKNEIAMNLKLNGRNTNKLYCQKHLMAMYEIDKSKYKEMIDDFKKQGCDLF